MANEKKGALWVLLTNSLCLCSEEGVSVLFFSRHLGFFLYIFLPSSPIFLSFSYPSSSLSFFGLFPSFLFLSLSSYLPSSLIILFLPPLILFPPPSIHFFPSSIHSSSSFLPPFILFSPQIFLFHLPSMHSSSSLLNTSSYLLHSFFILLHLSLPSSAYPLPTSTNPLPSSIQSFSSFLLFNLPSMHSSSSLLNTFSYLLHSSS